MCFPALLGALGGAGAAGAGAGLTAAGSAIAGAGFTPMIAAIQGATGLGSAATAAGVAGAGFGGLGSVLKMGGSLISAMGQAANARAMAAAAERSAQYAQERAREQIESGEQESDLRKRAGAKLMGENLVAMAANGIDVTSPAALDVLDDTQESVAQDAFRIRSNAYRQAKATSQQAANYKAEAASARSEGMFQPLATVLSGAAGVAERYAPWVAGNRYPGTSRDIMAGGY